MTAEENKKVEKKDDKLKHRKSTPNFKAMHERQFGNSKSIASFVERVSHVITSLIVTNTD